MKKVYDKSLISIFVVFIVGTLILSFAFNWKSMIGNLYENKDRIYNFSLSEEYEKDVISVVESTYNDGMFLKEGYIDLYGGLQRCMGKKIIWESDPNKTIMIGSDGKLYTAGNITMNFAEVDINKEELDKCAKKMAKLGKYVKSQGGDLIFFQAPARYDPDEVKLPIEISDNSKENVDYLYSKLKDNKNLSILNSQKLYKEAGLKFSDLFYKTDHHWNVQTAFFAYSEICKELNAEYDYNIDESYYNLDNWNVKTVKNSFLGTLGERSGGLFCGYDDAVLITPKFDGNYKKSVSNDYRLRIETGGGTQTNGKFSDAVLPVNKIKGRVKSFLGNYVCGDVAEAIVENENGATSKKILIIKDSYALPVSAFLTTCFKETRLIDLRYLTEKSAYDYIKEYKPDFILVLYNPNSYNDTFFNFDF
jgi:hypothetical protein